MHNRDKYPAIWAEFEKAQQALAPLLAERQVHTDAIDQVQAKIDALKAEKEAINAEAMKDADRIAELRTEIARYAKAMGAKTASGN